VFGVTPERFKLVARTHLAIRAVRETRAALVDIAHAYGFADQAHLTRAIRAVCATSPARLHAAGCHSRFR
jgi:AraC-like DNA-binding protein